MEVAAGHIHKGFPHKDGSLDVIQEKLSGEQGVTFMGKHSMNGQKDPRLNASQINNLTTPIQMLDKAQGSGNFSA